MLGTKAYLVTCHDRLLLAAAAAAAAAAVGPTQQHLCCCVCPSLQPTLALQTLALHTQLLTFIACQKRFEQLLLCGVWQCL
jgi:hypothetical protein